MKTPLTDAEGHFIAGFIEGEAHFGIVEQNGGQSYSCVMSLALRDDDAALLGWLVERTGVGTLSPVPARRTSRPQIRWAVRTQRDCQRLVQLLGRYELRGRKRREFEIWRSAVELASSGLDNRRVALRRLRAQLLASRRFRAPRPDERAPAPAEHEALTAYLHGFLCAEGSFNLTPSHAGVAIHLRQDDRPLLTMLAEATGLGRLRDTRPYPPANASTFWHVSTRRDVGAMAHWLSADQLRGRKADEVGPWLAGVRELQGARDPTARRARMNELVAVFRAARVYRPPAQLEASPPDRGRSEAVAAIRRWAETERGPLACQRYSAYRAAHDPRLPHRNTLTRRFGSWAAALETAGHGDRAASTREVREARVAGGASARAAYDEAQRRRVLKTLRFAVKIDGAGTLPTAMQFFRWRLINAPATPTQATVYRLFPGGWPAVLAAYEASGDQPSLA